MSLVDDLGAPLTEAELTRRRFLLALGTGALAAAGLGTLVTGVEFMKPNVLFEPATRFPIGRPEEIPEGSVLALPKKKLFLVRERGACYAMSAVCTHLGCIVQRRQEGGKDGFFCPCHGSAFDLEGRVTGGPAPRPLDRLEVTLQRGRLVVDVRKKVPHGTVVTL